MYLLLGSIFLNILSQNTSFLFKETAAEVTTDTAPLSVKRKASQDGKNLFALLHYFEG